METIVLGVTGHRFLVEIDRLMGGVEKAAQRILKTFPGSNFRVLSSLAEGADRLLAKRLLLILNARLWVPLPLPEEEYLKDFKTSRSKKEFISLLHKAEKVIKLPIKETREVGYLAAGKYIVENSNILLAIWDGKIAQGTAGTTEIVGLAKQRNLPLVWIHAGNRKPGTDIPTSIGRMQGKVTYENFPRDGRKI